MGSSARGDAEASARTVRATDDAVAVRHYRQARPDDASRIEAALAEAGGNKSRAAQLLGLTLRQLSYRISKLSSAPK
jgi:Nif-specific regulatory protein